MPDRAYLQPVDPELVPGARNAIEVCLRRKPRERITIELPVVAILAMILPSFAGSASFGSPARSTVMTLPNEMRSRGATSPSFCSVIGG